MKKTFKAYISMPTSPGGHEQRTHVLAVEESTGKLYAVRDTGNNGTEFKTQAESDAAVRRYYANQ